MDVKFWIDVYNTVKYWILGIIALGFAIELIIDPKNFLQQFYIIMYLPFGLLISIFYPAIFYGFFTFMVFYGIQMFTFLNGLKFSV